MEMNKGKSVQFVLPKGSKQAETDEKGPVTPKKAEDAPQEVSPR